MKHLFFITTLLLTSIICSASEWKVVAETTACAEKIQILGKEGEKYVLAVHGDQKTKLISGDGSAFTENAMRSTEFTSDKTNNVSYTFIQPSYVEANPPKIDVSFNGAKKRCKMQLRN